MIFTFYSVDMAGGTRVFTATLDECRRQAKSIHDYIRQNEGPDNLPDLPIYENALNQPDEAAMLLLLNAEDETGQEVFRRCVAARTLIETIVAA